MSLDLNLWSIWHLALGFCIWSLYQRYWWWWAVLICLADSPAVFLFVFVLKHSKRWRLHIRRSKMLELLFRTGVSVLNHFYCKISVFDIWRLNLCDRFLPGCSHLTAGRLFLQTMSKFILISRFSWDEDSSYRGWSPKWGATLQTAKFPTNSPRQSMHGRLQSDDDEFSMSFGPMCALHLRWKPLFCRSWSKLLAPRQGKLYFFRQWFNRICFDFSRAFIST